MYKYYNKIINKIYLINFNYNIDQNLSFHEYLFLTTTK